VAEHGAMLRICTILNRSPQTYATKSIMRRFDHKEMADTAQS